MRNFGRSGYKSNNHSSDFSRNDRRDDRNDRYHSNDKYRDSMNKVKISLISFFTI